ncbi:Uncharacterised protein [Streptococcus acidominimus]|uniref:DUF7720 domain-containing protein n=1 Tax=Streptococcus acidominimus TaxID=1326 RepID=A0A239XN20_STRAI|nr:hypothetical protein [Streptococcus acidominimus]SNV47762.1 Uncharacterised protein [Streptococcus acidominimus]
MKIIEMTMETPIYTTNGYEHWLDVRYSIGSHKYSLTKLIINDNIITDMSILENLILSDMIELLSHAYNVSTQRREFREKNWWLF